MAEKFSYEKAKEELEEILEELERGEAGIDTLAKLVKRASELIRQCREKLKTTDSEIQKILKDSEKGE